MNEQMYQTSTKNFFPLGALPIVQPAAPGL